MTKEINDDNFEAEVIQSDKPVLVDFWAPWCGPCRMLTPIIDEAAQEFEGSVKIVKCNIEDSPEAPTKYGVRSVPTLMIFKDGKLADTKIGAMQKPVLNDWIKSNI